MADEPITPDTLDAPAEPTDAPKATGLTLSSDDLAAWHSRIKRADARRELFSTWWDECLKSYAPSLKDAPSDYRTKIGTNRTFTIVERKSAELFYQRPEVTVAPSPLLEELNQPGNPMGDIVSQTHGDILNEKLGLDGVNVKNVARKAIFDYLLFGMGPTEVGYRAYQSAPQPTVVPVMDAMGQPVLDPLTGQPQTTVDAVKVTIKSECFWDHFSPKQLLIPDDCHSTDYDKDASWLGRRFKISLLDAKRLFDLPEDFEGSRGDTSTPMQFDHGDQADKSPMSQVVTGVRLHYKSSQFREDIIHPDHLTELVLIDGLKEPAKHIDCPLQKFDDQGRLTPDSLVGFPIHILVIRTTTDAGYVMSDVAVALPLIQELDKFREQMIRLREITLRRFFYNTDAIAGDDLNKLKGAWEGGMVGLTGAAFNQGDPIRPLTTGHYPQENFEFQNYIDTDLSRTHAIDATSAGTSAESGLTATEANLRQANVNVRLGWEQGFVADWFIQGATKFSTIIQQFFPAEEAAAIVGTSRAQLWEQMRHAVPTRFAFHMTPDSSLRNDTPLDRKQLQDVYTFLAQDPSLNRDYLNRKLLQKFHIDPSRAIIPEAQRQKPQPEPSIPTIAVKDLAILGDPLVLAFIKANPQWGIVIPPEVMMATAEIAQQQAQGQLEHGGKVAQLEGLSKHATDQTGAQNGSGQYGPNLGGGVVQ